MGGAPVKSHWLRHFDIWRHTHVSDFGYALKAAMLTHRFGLARALLLYSYGMWQYCKMACIFGWCGLSIVVVARCLDGVLLVHYPEKCNPIHGVNHLNTNSLHVPKCLCCCLTFHFCWYVTCSLLSFAC